MQVAHVCEDKHPAKALPLVSTADLLEARAIYPQLFKTTGELSFHGLVQENCLWL